MTTTMAKPTLDGFTADEIFDYFRFGMRRILGVADGAIPPELWDFVERAVAEFVQTGQPVPRATFHRFMLGELTDGIVPRERLEHQEEDFRALEWFAGVLEILSGRCDGMVKVPETSTPTRKDLLRQGNLGPFALTILDGSEYAMCWACKEGQPIDVIMALRDMCCTHCGAVDKSGSRKDAGNGHRPKSKPASAGKPGRK